MKRPMYLSTSSCESTTQSTSPLRTREPAAPDEVVGPFRVFRVLAVVLQKAAHVPDRVVVRAHHAEHVALAHSRARRSADVDLPFAALDGHGPQVLGGRLGAVARAAGGSELHLVRRLDALEALLDGDAERGRMAYAVAAEVGPDARLAGAEGFRGRVSRGHSHVAPP